MKKTSSRHLGRLLVSAIGLATILLLLTWWLLAPTSTGRAPSIPRNIPPEAFQRVQIDPTRLPEPPVTPEALLLPTRAPRPSVKVPAPAVVVVTPEPTEKPSRPPQPSVRHQLSGSASWYCKAGVSVCHYQYPDGPGFDAYAAAGGPLRRAIGPGWRGTVVTVDGIRVKLIDWCGCPEGRIIDLYWDVAHALGIGGVGRVTIRW